MVKHKGGFEIEKRENMRGGPGTATIEHFFRKGEFGGEHFRACARLILPPGAGVGPHAHEGEDEAYLIVKGRGRVTDAGVTSEVSAGDAILTGRGNTHSITNTGDDTLEAVAIIVTY
jgi:mannose-6-phosphate isomerase-like protein (cupin superfamily)